MGEVSEREQGGETRNWRYPRHPPSTCNESEEETGQEGETGTESSLLWHIEMTFELLFIVTFQSKEGIEVKQRPLSQSPPRKKDGEICSPA